VRDGVKTEQYTLGSYDIIHVLESDLSYHLWNKSTYSLEGKSSLHPQPMKGGTHHPSTYENGFFSP
jgi:hypothetical protein